MVFSSETGQWTDTNVTMEGFKLRYGKGEYFHGAIYWIVINRESGLLSCYRFDIAAENLTEISVPPKAYVSHFRHFGESSGHLYLACVRDDTAEILNVYELDQVTLKWVIKHWVHINRLIPSFPQDVRNGRNQICHSAGSILSILRGEEEEGSVLVKKIDRKVVAYNLKSKKVDVLLDELRFKPQRRTTEHLFPLPFVPAYPFVSTLYPLE
ncbi:uncharacterized protein LOC141723419 [Apium graveolens]|uniref:uncharacterized protein LOC141723419 n=1 Tax=Apium graveolens TaxID=4045 RepID=UPI003D7ABD1F